MGSPTLTRGVAGAPRRRPGALVGVAGGIDVGVVGAGSGPAPADDRGHAWAHDGSAVGGSLGGLLATEQRVHAEAEVSAGAVAEAAVESEPAVTPGRVPDVDVDVAPERVERVPGSGRREAIYRISPVREQPEEMVEPAVDGPVRLDPEPGQWPRPVR